MLLYGEIIPEIIDRTGAQIMLYLTCTPITSVDLAHYRVSRAKDWVSVDFCGTMQCSVFFQAMDASLYITGTQVYR